MSRGPEIDQIEATSDRASVDRAVHDFAELLAEMALSIEPGRDPDAA